MRLLRVKDYQFEEFYDQLPKYAILSHTWGKEEVSLQDLQDSKDPFRSFAKSKQGWAKVEYALEQARTDSYEYVWIDTCCIDQRNPTDLATSINSMFNWYRNAAVCYVYLEDVTYEPEVGLFDPIDPKEDLGAFIIKSRWITRGWTLQELIAPPSVLFFNSKWRYLTSRERSAGTLAAATGIDSHALSTGSSSEGLSEYSIATRMSWAAGRRTTRPEDRAYSLFGLFDVTMLTHYGEGERKAFTRLQEEIIRYSADQSLFAWEVRDGEQNDGLLFAPSPDCFHGRGHIIPSVTSTPIPYRMNNRGLDIDIEGFRRFWNVRIGDYSTQQAILDCRSEKHPRRVFLLNLFPEGQGEYTVSPYSDCRCEEMDWLALKRREGMNRFRRCRITIKRSSTKFTIAPISIYPSKSSYAGLHLDVQQPAAKYGRRELSCYETYPPGPQVRYDLYFSPNHDDTIAEGIGASLRYQKFNSDNQVEYMEEFLIAIATDPDDPLFTNPKHSTEHLDRYKRRPIQSLPKLLIMTKQAQTHSPLELRSACSRIGSLKAPPHDAFLRTFPVIQTVKLGDGTRLRVTLDRTKILSEPNWVAVVRVLEMESYLVRARSKLWMLFFKPIVFMVMGWNDKNIERYARQWPFALLVFLTSLLNPVALLSPILNAIETEMMFLGSMAVMLMFTEWHRLNNPWLYIRPAGLDARGSVPPLLYFGRFAGAMYPRMELFYLCSLVLSALSSHTSWSAALVPILYLTMFRDCVLLLSKQHFIPRILRVSGIVTLLALAETYSSFQVTLLSIQHIYRASAVSVLFSGTIMVYFMWSRQQLLT